MCIECYDVAYYKLFLPAKLNFLAIQCIAYMLYITNISHGSSYISDNHCGSQKHATQKSFVLINWFSHG